MTTKQKVGKVIQEQMLLNVGFDSGGSLVKRVDWKSLRGMVKELKKQNKTLTKLGLVADFTIRLPLKP